MVVWRYFYQVSWPMAVSGFLLGLFFAAPNCTCSAKWPVERIVIDRLESAADIPLSREQMQLLVRESLEKHAQVYLKEGQDSALRVKIYQKAKAEQNEGSQLVVTLKYLPVATGSFSPYWGMGIGEMSEKSQPMQAFTSAFEAALSQVLFLKKQNEKSSLLRLAELKQYAAGEEVPLKQLLQAIHLLGFRKEKQAVPFLAKLLEDANPVLASACLSTLTKIGDDAALQIIIQYSERKPPQVRRQVIAAAKQIGGKTALAWLFTMSTGYEDPQTRKEAHEAFKAVQKRLETTLPISTLLEPIVKPKKDG